MLNINKSLIRQYAVVITVNLSVLCSGLSIAWPSPVLVKLSGNDTNLARPVTENEGSWIVSIGALTIAAVSFLACFLVDRIGRKYSVIISYAPRIIMCLTLTFASQVWMVILGRALSGLCDALILATVPMYASEIASKEVRGSLGTFFQIFSSIGILIMLSVGPFLEYFTLNAMMLCFCVVTLLPLFFLPDSPYFLHSKGRTNEALKVLLYLRDTKTAAKDELREYSISEKEQQISVKELLNNKIFLKAASIAIVICVGMQLVGFNAVSFYLQTVLESTQTSVRPEVASAVIGSIQLLASFSATLVTDRFGRKPILTSTLIGQALGMMGLGIFFKLKDEGPVTGFLNYLPLISLILVVYCYSAGLGCVSWGLLADLFDGRTRAVGMTLAIQPSMFLLFLTVKYFASVTTAIGAPATYGIFSVNCVLMCLFIGFCVPETKGKTTAEIQIALGAKYNDDVKKEDCYNILVVNLSVLCSGLSIAWPSPVLVKLSGNDTNLARPVTENEGSWIVSIGALTIAAVSFLACFLVDRIGRKYSVIISYAPRIIMCLTLTFASQVWMVILGRALSGLCDVLILATVPMYASEIASKEVRGSLGTFFQIFSSIGILIMLSVGPFLEYFTLNAMMLCFCVVTLLPLFFLPDSPYFLHSKGRTNEALKVLLYLRDTKTAAKDELREYSISEKEQQISVKELLNNKIFLKAASIAIVICVGMQLVGFNAVSFYLQTVLESTQTSVRPEIASAVIGSIQLLASFSATLVTDRFGRKPILTSTLIGQALGMMGLGIFFKLKDEGPVTGFLNYLPLISLILVVYCYSAGLGCVSWGLLADLFDGRTRAVGMTLAIQPSMFLLFLTVKYFASVTTAIGAPATYGIFSVNCVLMCLFIGFCVPETKGKTTAEIQIALGVNLSVLCTGLSIAWPSPVLVKLSGNDTNLARPVTENEGSWIVSIGALTTAAVSFLVCFLVDRIGRKYSVIISYAPRIIMCLTLTFASQVWMVILGRALSGLCDGLTFATVPMYASEIASKEVRGSLGTFLQIFSSIGILIMLSAGPFLEYFTLNAMMLCFCVVTLLPLFFLPDSPYFLHSKGRTDEALKVLFYLRDTETAAKDELREYSISEKEQKISVKELLNNKIFLKAASIAIVVCAGMQLVGFNAVSFYLQTVLESTQTSVRPEVASAVIGSIQLLASFSATLVTDRFGRKPILTSTLIGQALGMMGLGIFFKLQDEGPVTGFLNYLPLISLILVVYCYSAGLGCVSWGLLAELFDGRTRAVGVTLAIQPSMILLFLTVKYFASVTTAIGAPATYGIFSVNCVLMCLFIGFCVPETKGKTTTEIQIALGAKYNNDYVKKEDC